MAHTPAEFTNSRALAATGHGRGYLRADVEASCSFCGTYSGPWVHLNARGGCGTWSMANRPSGPLLIP